MMTDELLPCPFCGGQAELHQTYDMETKEVIGWFVWCNNKRCECMPETNDHFTEAEAIAAWNTRAATTIGKVQVEVEPVLHGTLTAEQVRELIAPHLHARPTFDFGRHGAVWRADFQAIADELNAELGSGTCEVVASSADGLTTDNIKQWFKLSCGHAFKIYGLDVPVACPVCGKEVKR